MGQGRRIRWVIVLTVVAVLACLPWAVGQLPAAGSAVTSATLLSRVQSSAGVTYSGYAESTGSLALPVTTGEFSSIADLFGSTTQLRVWWGGGRDWRVDEITPTGEQDVHAAGDDLWTWNYESSSLQLQLNAQPSTVYLPRADDLVPASLARRLLSQATPGEVHRIASRRIAGHEAAGLRYVPAASQSTISHVDVWALPGSGLPVSVAVYGKSPSGDTTALVSSTMLDLSTTAPSASAIAFTPPPGADTRNEQAPDLLALADRITGLGTPARLGGLPRDSITPTNSSVTVYGSGVTVLVAIPLFGRTAGQLASELTKAVGSSRTAVGLANSIGPVSLLLTNRLPPVLVGGKTTFDPGEVDPTRPISWLLVGTVTPSTLQQAGNDLVTAAGGKP
jgi:hypothetical protein